VLTDWYLPGTKAGGPVRSIFSLTALLKDHFDFYIITTNTDLGSNEPYPLFEKEGINYYYFSKERLNVQHIIEQINLIDPSLIYINSVWSALFSIAILRAKKQGLIKAPILLAPRGMLSSGALGLKSLKKLSFLFLAKLMRWYEGITFHATNEEEKRDILAQFKNARVVLAPNLNSGTVYSVVKPKEKNHLRLFYLSRIAKVKNLHYALEILSTVPASYQIEYDIYGNIEDEGYWSLCKNLISKLPPHIKVTYRRELPFNEVQAVIVSYHALLLPTLNENFGHSIVESLLSGCQVIISDQTPWNDVNSTNAGYAIPLADKTAFTKAIIQLAALDHTDYDLKSAAAIRYISSRLNIEKSIEQYKIVFNEPRKN
jgi:glycosyltransferase involved in cell wall biosynthesis